MHHVEVFIYILHHVEVFIYTASYWGIHTWFMHATVLLRHKIVVGSWVFCSKSLTKKDPKKSWSMSAFKPCWILRWKSLRSSRFKANLEGSQGASRRFSRSIPKASSQDISISTRAGTWRNAILLVTPCRSIWYNAMKEYLALINARRCLESSYHLFRCDMRKPTR